MMGSRNEAQAALFYEFNLEGLVPADHLLRSIDRFLDFVDIRIYLQPFCSDIGRSSIDPELMKAIAKSNADAAAYYCKALPLVSFYFLKQTNGIAALLFLLVAGVRSQGILDQTIVSIFQSATKVMMETSNSLQTGLISRKKGMEVRAY